MPVPVRFTLPKSRILRGHLVFKSIRDAGRKRTSGPMILWAAPNDQTFSRLGIGLGKIVGNAVTRNRIKRHLKEAFRLHQHDLPNGFDFVVTLRPHDELPGEKLREHFLSLVQAATEK